MPFSNGTVESHLDETAVLVNITDRKSFVNQEKGSKVVHTHSKKLGLHPSVLFCKEGSDFSDKNTKCDLRLSRRTVFEGMRIESTRDLPAFKIGTDDQGNNALTGEAGDSVDIAKMEVWSLE